ncbi:MAG TPA: hypothetical protein VL503_11710 [Candidatus Omnitrophota bacterium]|nr:hypothetical protein [Candidatus Omnitrophota bacterium]
MRRDHARILPALLAAAALLLPAPSSLSAGSTDELYGPFLPSASSFGPVPKTQPLSEGDRVAREIVRTDAMIAGLEGRVRRSASDKSRSDLRNARERQTEAREASGQSFYARANRLTLEARAYLKSALIQAGPPESDPEVVGRALEQTDDALARGKDIVEAASFSRQRLMLKSLQDRQENARRLYKNGYVRSAYGETRDVRNGVVDLLRQCADLPVSRDTARRALRRAERVLVQTKKEMGSRPASRALRLERDAELQLARARDSFSRNAFRDTLLHSKLVERHLQRAMEANRLATNQSD